MEQQRQDEPAAWRDVDMLLAYLRDRDVACPLCGYNVRNLHEPRCPECGQPLKLSVSLAEPYLKAWLVGAVALIASAGTGCFLVIAVVSGAGFPNFRSWIAVVDFFSFMATIPVAALWVLGRRRFLRFQREAQRWWARAAAVLALLQFVFIPSWIK